TTENRENLKAKNHSVIKSSKEITQKSSSQKNQNKSASKRKDVLICGDSMLNNIEGNGVSTKSVKSIVRSFPGADSTDMIDYLKPLLNKKKPKYLILHVGTNDITVKNLEKIREMINQITPETE
uniref:Scavenger receptor cysteine-rich type 1 M130 n=1 Tax=Clytia hemisphaerica TaxID=252671 RepID=A0A7M5XKD4_9CNID